MAPKRAHSNLTNKMDASPTFFRESPKEMQSAARATFGSQCLASRSVNGEPKEPLGRLVSAHRLSYRWRPERHRVPRPSGRIRGSRWDKLPGPPERPFFSG